MIIFYRFAVFVLYSGSADSAKVVKYDNKGLEREDKYNITVASEIMAVLCMSRDINDLKK